ncbi:MAG: hypothetical protein QOF56_4036, partial [Acidobacteriaceae bacterium]|nr:hypothetical protein [Acidobacteriaceae bacterium]
MTKPLAISHSSLLTAHCSLL